MNSWSPDSDLSASILIVIDGTGMPVFVSFSSELCMSAP